MDYKYRIVPEYPYFKVEEKREVWKGRYVRKFPWLFSSYERYCDEDWSIAHNKYPMRAVFLSYEEAETFIKNRLAMNEEIAKKKAAFPTEIKYFPEKDAGLNAAKAKLVEARVDLPVGHEFLHVKTLGRYRIVSHSIRESDLEVMVQYVNTDDRTTTWDRPYSEFIDGRFKRQHSPSD